MSKYDLDPQSVLQNKLGITDQEQLREAEAAICHVRLLELESSPVQGAFDFTHLRHIHERLFADVYFFAGQIRDVDLSKGDSRFCLARYIEDVEKEIFTKLRAENILCGLDKSSFIQRLSYYAGELNALHPFREGNGRTLRVFLKQLAWQAGYEIAYHQAGEEELLQADIAAFKGDLGPLISLFKCIVTPSQEL